MVNNSLSRNKNIYGVFGGSDSEPSDEEYYSPYIFGNRSHDSKKRKSKTLFSEGVSKFDVENNDTMFESAGLLNLSENDGSNEHQKVSDSTTDKRLRMDINSDDDFIDRIIADDLSEDDGDDTMYPMTILRAKKNLPHLGVNTNKHINKSDNDINNINSHVMEKMYGKGLKMLQKMGYKGGGLGKDGSGTVIPIEIKGKNDQMGLHNGFESDDIIHSNKSRYDDYMNKSQRKTVLYSNGWKKYSDGDSENMVSYTGSCIGLDDIDELIIELDKRCKLSEDSLKNAFINRKKLEKTNQDLILEQARLKQAIKENDELIDKCNSKLSFILESYNSFNDTVNNDIVTPEKYRTALNKLLDSLMSIFDFDTAVFDTLLLGDLAAHCVKLTLDYIYIEWDIYSEFDRGVDVLNYCSSFFKHCSILNKIIPIVNTSVVKQLTQFLNDEWNVYETEFGLKLYELWIDTLKFIDNISSELGKLITNRLITFVSNSSNIHISHIIIHPWLSIFNETEISYLVEKFVESMKSSLSNRTLNDVLKCKTVLNNWNTLLDKNNTDTLMTHISNILAYTLQSIEINPSNQETEAIENTIKWVEVIGYDRMGEIFSSSFFPRWIKVLSTWLRSPICNYDEVITWYIGWKTLITPQLMKISTVERFFKDALKLMDKASSDPIEVTEKIHTNKNVKHVQIDDLLSKIEDIANQHGITMIPRVGRFYDGKQIYAFGKSTIVLNQVVFLMEKGKLREVTIEQLLNIAK